MDMSSKIKKPYLEEMGGYKFAEQKIPLVMQIVEKTIGFDLPSTEFNDIGKKVQELLEKCTEGKFTTNGANGITEEVVAYPSENKNA